MSSSAAGDPSCREALRFYAGTLGLEHRTRSGIRRSSEAVEVGLSDAPVSLLLCPLSLVRRTATAAGPRIGGWTGVRLGCRDVVSEYRQLTKRGVRFIGTPEKQPWGAVEALFLDQDENVLALCEQRQWPRPRGQ